MTTYCSKGATGGQGKFASNFWKKVTYKKGKGKKGKAYVQREFCFACCYSQRTRTLIDNPC